MPVALGFQDLGLKETASFCSPVLRSLYTLHIGL
jgi:hypothetical protein